MQVTQEDADEEPLTDDARERKNRRLLELIAQARDGDVAAFEKLYNAAAPWLLRVIRRLVAEDHAEDVLADLFIQVWRSLPQYDAARGVPAVWLSMMARSRALDHLRRESQRDALPADALQSMESTLDGPEQLLSREQQRQLVQFSLSTAPLSPQERLLLGLAYFKDQTQQDISRLTGLPLGTVKTVLVGAQRKLRMQISGQHRLGPAPAEESMRSGPHP